MGSIAMADRRRIAGRGGVVVNRPESGSLGVEKALLDRTNPVLVAGFSRDISRINPHTYRM